MTTPVVLGPTQPINAPQAVPPATGLVALANKPDMAGDDRWELGYSYRPEFPSGVVRNRSSIAGTIGQSIGGVNTDSTRVTVIPVYHTVEDVNSTIGHLALDLEGRATRGLEAYTSKLVAHEFWTGEIAKTDGLPNPVLSGPNTVDITGEYAPGALAPQAAVAALMQALADNGMGDGMIHCSRYVGIRLPDAWRNEQTMQDHGFVVVSDAGYPGTGPTGQAGVNWMYATAPVNVRLGAIELIPEEIRQSIDRASNTITYRAQRVGGVDFAGPCFAIQVTP